MSRAPLLNTKRAALPWHITLHMPSPKGASGGGSNRNVAAPRRARALLGLGVTAIAVIAAVRARLRNHP